MSLNWSSGHPSKKSLSRPVHFWRQSGRLNGLAEAQAWSVFEMQGFRLLQAAIFPVSSAKAAY
jgi:hypothetical protein